MNGMLIDEDRFSEFHFGAELAEPLLGIMLLDNAYDRLNPLCNIPEVHWREIRLPQGRTAPLFSSDDRRGLS